MRFEAQVDQWAHALVGGMIIVAIAVFYLCWLFTSKLFLLIGCLLILLLAFVLPIYWKSYYVLDEHDLLIRAGFLRWKIPYLIIHQAVSTSDMSISIALSVNRLDLRWLEGGRMKKLLIAPKDRELFQRMLLWKNPRIRIDDNEKQTRRLIEELQAMLNGSLGLEHGKEVPNQCKNNNEKSSL